MRTPGVTLNPKKEKEAVFLDIRNYKENVPVDSVTAPNREENRVPGRGSAPPPVNLFSTGTDVDVEEDQSSTSFRNVVCVLRVSTRTFSWTGRVP